MVEDVTKSLNTEEFEPERFQLTDRDVLDDLGFDNIEDIVTSYDDGEEEMWSPSSDNFSSNSGFPNMREDEQFCELVSRQRHHHQDDDRGDGIPISSANLENDDDIEIEDDGNGGLIRVPRNRHRNANIFYAPDRGPPIVDFLTVVTAFFVAVLAAYYSISF